jgi:hypothetical protein
LSPSEHERKVELGRMDGIPERVSGHLAEAADAESALDQLLRILDGRRGH